MTTKLYDNSNILSGSPIYSSTIGIGVAFVYAKLTALLNYWEWTANWELTKPLMISPTIDMQIYGNILANPISHK